MYFKGCMNNTVKVSAPGLRPANNVTINFDDSTSSTFSVAVNTTYTVVTNVAKAPVSIVVYGALYTMAQLPATIAPDPTHGRGNVRCEITTNGVLGWDFVVNLDTV